LTSNGLARRKWRKISSGPRILANNIFFGLTKGLTSMEAKLYNTSLVTSSAGFLL
jgi:hypothetical protein